MAKKTKLNRNLVRERIRDYTYSIDALKTKIARLDKLNELFPNLASKVKDTKEKLTHLVSQQENELGILEKLDYTKEKAFEEFQRLKTSEALKKIAKEIPSKAYVIYQKASGSTQGKIINGNAEDELGLYSPFEKTEGELENTDIYLVGDTVFEDGSIIARATRTLTGLLSIKKSKNARYLTFRIPDQRGFDIVFKVQAENESEVIGKTINQKELYFESRVEKGPFDKVYQITANETGFIWTITKEIKDDSPKSGFNYLVDSSLGLYGVPHEFPSEVLQAAQKVPQKVLSKDLKDRVDLTDVNFITIDGEDARDFDDAVFATKFGDGFRLLVAIADVSYYVKPASALDIEAQKRGTSVYFPEKVIPMLPVELSNGICSLNPNVVRCAFVCDALISKAGEITAYQFYKAAIVSKRRTTYTQVWNAIKEGGSWQELGELKEEITNLYELYKVLRKKRVERKALDFETSEIMATLDESGKINGFKEREHNDAHRLIEEMMLVANVCAANWVISEGLLTLFRVHPEPEESKVLSAIGAKRVKAKDSLRDAVFNAIESSKNDEIRQMEILRSMARALYQPENIGHYGLNYEEYCHFTSPIRRYPDLLTHRVIEGIIKKRHYHPKVYVDISEIRGYDRPMTEKVESKNKDWLAWQSLGEIASLTERRADEVTRAVLEELKKEYLKSFKKKRFSGKVTGLNQAGLFVKLDDCDITGYVHVTNIALKRSYYWDIDEDKKIFRAADFPKVQICVGDDVEVELDESATGIAFRLINDVTLIKKLGTKLPETRSYRKKRRFADNDWY